MPTIVPPFVQYQAPLIPIPGKWRKDPPEGDKFIPLEIDWGLTVPVGRAVQIALNSGPIEFSQIVAFSVDNGRNGADVTFLFPDTGRQLTVPAYSQGVYPVFTNALTFYVISDVAQVSDVTVFEVLNSMPPAVSVLPSQEQSHSGVTNVDLGTVGNQQIIPLGVTGTIQTIAVTASGANASASSVTATLKLIDGIPTDLWLANISVPPTSTISEPITVPGLRLRFVNGVAASVLSTTIAPGAVRATVNLFYSVP